MPLPSSPAQPPVSRLHLWERSGQLTECRGRRSWPPEPFHFFKKKDKASKWRQAHPSTKVAQRGVQDLVGGRGNERVARVPDLCPHGLLRL